MWLHDACYVDLVHFEFVLTTNIMEFIYSVNRAAINYTLRLSLSSVVNSFICRRHQISMESPNSAAQS